MEEQSQPPVTPAESQPPTQAPLKPHRGVLVLVLGILGLVLCFILGIVAWVMGKNDLREIDAGIMDPAGRGLTQAGKICGMISVIVQIIIIGIWLLMGLFAGGVAVSQ
jgi:flagellar biogenesis protein FliO